MRSDPLFRNHPIPALAVICLSVFVISVDATIVNVALPTLSRELGADTEEVLTELGFDRNTCGL